MLAGAAEKTDVVRQAIIGPVTSQVTASVLQLHPNVTVVIDGETGERLKRKEYYLYVERMAEQVEHKIGI